MSTSLERHQLIMRAKRLKYLRQMTGLIMQEFADLCNIGLTTVNYWENVVTKGISARGAKKVITALKSEGIEASLEWLMDGIGEPPKIVDQSKLSKLNLNKTGSSHLVITNEINIEKQLIQEVKLFQQLHPENLITTITDNAMLPFYKIGDVVGGKRLTGANMELANGFDCIVANDDKSLIVRQVKLGSHAGTFSLYCSNPEATIEYPALTNIKVNALAPISRLWRKI